MTPARTALLAAALALAACAPDSWTNRGATGLNGFVNQVNRICYPVQLGRTRMADPLQVSDEYDYWFDQTSRLYAGSLSQGQYRASLNGFFGAGNDGAIDCILAQLPPPGAR